MNYFSRLFKAKAELIEPDIQFGRFTDSYKSDEKYTIWQKSIDLFENEKYLFSFKALLEFLTVEDKNNVTYHLDQGKLTFSLTQGSRIIQGEADHIRFMAEAKVAWMQNKHLGLMRLLLEENFDLKYARYAIDSGEYICLKFDTFVEDASPHKLYQALKELSTVADRRDDVLMQTYSDLKPLNDHRIRQISDQEKEIKFRFFKNQVHNVIQEIDHGKLNGFLYPGGVSFLLLDLLYKVDFLLKPEGKIMESISESHDLYFNDNVISVQDKNKVIIKKVKVFENITFLDFCGEMYEVNSTFGISVPDGHQRLVDIIDAQISDFEWYYENRYLEYAKAICGYVAGFVLYSYSLPEPTKALLKLYYRIIYFEFFTDLGYVDGIFKKGKYDKNRVEDLIEDVVLKHKVKYPNVSLNTKVLDFIDECMFRKSYLMMLRNLKY